MLTISHHAIQRYQERVANVPEDQARAALSTRAIQIAAKFGARFVRLGTGHRVAISDSVVVTVLPAMRSNRNARRLWDTHGGNVPTQTEVMK